ncbi:MAG TPA: rhomboid family intramembrane serine protease [Jatrophihabitans sp.]
MTSRQPFALPFGRNREARGTSEPRFDPTSWTGALIVMGVFTFILYVIQFFNADHDYSWNRFGLKPRQVDGLWGVVTQPFLHQSWGHLLSNTLPLLAIGWTLLLSGVRVFLFVTAVVIVVGGFATWLVAPSNEVIVGASGMIFGWLGYLLARAIFSRRLRWIVVAVLLLIFFGTLLGSLLPSVDSRVSWQSHVCGALAGIGVAWLLHPRKSTNSGRTRRSPVR